MTNGEQVKTLGNLNTLVQSRRSVTSPLLDRPYSAAWIINHSGARILGLINAGLYVCEKGMINATESEKAVSPSGQEEGREDGQKTSVGV